MPRRAIGAASSHPLLAGAPRRAIMRMQPACAAGSFASSGPSGWAAGPFGSLMQMRLETNLERIENLASQRENANWAFRCFLKGSSLSSGRIDSIVHRHYRAVAAQIDCRHCANCCRAVRPLLKIGDIRRLALHLNMSEDQFATAYLVQGESGEGHSFRSLPCPLLKENLCTVYPHRPADCRSFPHVHKKDFVFRITQAWSNCSVCPIVFNVFELLKRDLWRERKSNY